MEFKFVIKKIHFKAQMFFVFFSWSFISVNVLIVLSQSSV